MTFDPIIAAIRFGTGLSPNVEAPKSVSEMLTTLRGPDSAANDHPIPRFAQAQPSPAEFQRLTQLKRRNQGTEVGDHASEDLKTIQRQVRVVQEATLQTTLARAITTKDGLRERLVSFWADHFTVRADGAVRRHLVTPYVEEAIRPYVMGRFADMLRAVVTHPMMLLYLDQVRSVGPNSRQAQRQTRGLNENMAREVLELHTLGVGGPYTQTDVRELAKLMTGLSYTVNDGFVFRNRFAEPGAETVLGIDYGGQKPALDDVLSAMGDLAVHPSTARHLAQKLAVHFVTDTPDPALVAALEAEFNASDGDLGQVVAAMLGHPAAWALDHGKVKQPLDFMKSSLRALAVDTAAIKSADRRQMRRRIISPLRIMGQPWEQPLGPDGWAENAEAWITPQGMAGRITWAMRAPERLLDRLPDPREFVFSALGERAPQEVIFAANSAESASEAIGLILSSPAFQRR